MGINIDCHVFEYEDLKKKTWDKHVEENKGEHIPYSEFIFKFRHLLDDFGLVLMYSDSFVIVNNEYYDESPYYYFISAMDKTFKLNGTFHTEVLWKTAQKEVPTYVECDLKEKYNLYPEEG